MQRLVFPPLAAQFCVAGLEVRCQRLQLAGCWPRDGGGGRGQEALVEGVGDGGGVSLGVGAGQPVEDVAQFHRRAQGGGGGDGFAAVDGQVALLAQEVGFGADGGGDVVAEAGVVEEGGQVVVVGVAKRAVVFVEPAHGQLQGAAGVKTGAARVGLHVCLDAPGGVVEVGPFSLQEGEVAHGGGVVGWRNRVFWKNPVSVLENPVSRATHQTARMRSDPLFRRVRW